MSKEQILYECLRCGTIAPLKDWEREETNVFKCPYCSFKVGKKMRPPIVKRVKAR